ncbi:MAG: HAMP domain-containing histidine kinase, partial [Bacteroidetes bacterium]|nr:HAMP domain-containing histidine kinase [Bacteroidota bacterium]
LRIAVKYNIVYNQAYAMIGFATVYNMRGQYQTAYSYAIKGQHLGVMLGNLSIRATGAMQLSKTYAGLGKVADAYRSLNEYIGLKNGLKNNESIQKLTSYNYELNFSVKQRLQAQQQHEKELIYEQNLRTGKMRQWMFGIIIIATLIIACVYYFDRRRQRKINRLLKINNSVVLEQRNNLDQQAHKLNDLNTLKDRLIAILAHDLRAPLSTLRGLFDLLQDDTISHEQMLEMIPPVMKKLDHTSDFLDTLLFWINSQMENFGQGVKQFALDELIAKEIQNLNEQASAKKISLFANTNHEIVGYADPDSVRIVIRNLVSNAIKFCEEDDIIEISAKNKGDNVLVQVKDTGVGMTAEQSQKIFRGKMQSKIGTHNESGTGMGLLFCKDLIEKCNGTIWVKSKQGVGSEFSFTIPKS